MPLWKKVIQFDHQNHCSIEYDKTLISIVPLLENSEKINTMCGFP